MRAELSLTIMSLGGGVQSSVMALMASQSLPPTGSGGGFDRVPDCAIFLRRHPLGAAQRLRARRVARRPALSFPLYVVDNGRSLREDLRALTNHSGSRSYVDIPVYLKGRGGEGDGIGSRQCTDNYKIRHTPKDTRDARTETPTARPRRDDRRAVAGHVHRRGHTHEDLPRPMDNQSLPAHREGDVQAGLRRLVDLPLRQTPGALCPFQSRHRWVETKRRWPELFAEAVEIDARLRDGLAFAKEPYLHALRMPLAEAVTLDEAKMGEDEQRDGFGNECEGH